MCTPRGDEPPTETTRPQTRPVIEHAPTCSNFNCRQTACAARTQQKTRSRLTSGFSLVELRGLEPLTPTLPVWCATSCAIAPGVPIEVTPPRGTPQNRWPPASQAAVLLPGYERHPMAKSGIDRQVSLEGGHNGVRATLRPPPGPAAGRACAPAARCRGSPGRTSTPPPPPPESAR